MNQPRLTPTATPAPPGDHKPPSRWAATLFSGAGTMSRTCREFDWDSSPLGRVDAWPHSLRTAASMVVGQGIAQVLCWGPDLVQIYNDAYVEVLGDKHPCLGRPVLEVWSEIRAEIEPLFRRVLDGETVYFEDLRLSVQRYGRLEDAYFTFSYSPVRIESGEVGAVLVNCFETTRQVAARALQCERDELLHELQVERARLEFVFQHAPAFLAVVRGPDHVFELVNESYLRLMGSRSMLGRPLAEVVPEAEEQGFLELLDHVLESGETYVGVENEVRLRDPGGNVEERFLNFVYLPLVGVDGKPTGVIVHGTDVTEEVTARRQVERLLVTSEEARAEAEAARAEAEAANRAKADFLASMSHELRTPLNAIGGYAELLEMEVHGPITPAQRGALERIGHSQRHLLSLINDLLAFARIEAGRIEVNLRPLNLSEVLAGVEPLVGPVAEGKGISYMATAPEGLVVVADSERLRQILVNIVGNGLKFTPPGGAVGVTCNGAGRWVEVRVRDDGPGIPGDKHCTIFDPFTQVDRRLNRPKDGVGLGLAISRDLARAMGGDILVDSEEGQGSTFIIRLPRGEAA